MTDPTRRFSDRVDAYVRYRPSYPAAVLEILRARCGLTPASIVADIGSGTGLLTEPFLKHGNPVFAVEPNPEMRAAGERLLAHYPGFVSVPGTAEATTLADHSIDLITAGQAFHWFDRAQARAEFARILRPGGWVALIWNERETETTPFLRDYETLLQTYATDYAQVDHRQIDDTVLADFFHPHPMTVETLQNRQDFDLDGVRGRLLSSSYAPAAGHPNHEPMLAELARLFAAHAVDGRVAFTYTTKVYLGRLSSA